MSGLEEGLFGFKDMKKETVPVCIAYKSKIDFSDPVPISGKIKLAVMGPYNLAVCVS